MVREIWFVLPCQEHKQPKTKCFKLLKNFQKMGWFICDQNYQQMMEAQTNKSTISLMYTETTPISYQHFLSGHANMYSSRYISLCKYLIASEYTWNHNTSFGRFIDMHPAMSPMRLIHLSFSDSSPSLAKIWRKKYFVVLQDHILHPQSEVILNVSLPFPFQGHQHIHRMPEMQLEDSCTRRYKRN